MAYFFSSPLLPFHPPFPLLSPPPTPFSGHDDRAEFETAGADALMMKPVNLHQIIQCLQSSLLKRAVTADKRKKSIDESVFKLSQK